MVMQGREGIEGTQSSENDASAPYDLEENVDSSEKADSLKHQRIVMSQSADTLQECSTDKHRNHSKNSVSMTPTEIPNMVKAAYRDTYSFMR